MSRRALGSTLVATLLVTIGCLCGGAVDVARAQDQTGEVLIVLASEQGGVIDADLAQEPALRQPPFNSYRSMRVLRRAPVTLRVNEPMVVPLPNGRNLQIVLVSMLPNGRMRVRVSINRPEKTDYLQGVTVETSAGVPFFIAGQAFQGGTLVIGVRVGLRVGVGARIGPVGPRFGPPFGAPRPPLAAPGAVRALSPGAVQQPGAVRVAPPPGAVQQPGAVRVQPPPGAVQQPAVRIQPPPGAVRAQPPRGASRGEPASGPRAVVRVAPPR